MKTLITLSLILLLPAISYAGIFGRRCNHCVQNVVVPTQVIVESETYIVPSRVTRFAEIKGLQFVDDSYGNSYAVVDGKIRFALSEPSFIKTETELKGGTVENVRTTEVNNFGQKIIIEQREIRR